MQVMAILASYQLSVQGSHVPKALGPASWYLAAVDAAIRAASAVAQER
jgi:hypothetical protein